LGKTDTKISGGKQTHGKQCNQDKPVQRVRFQGKRQIRVCGYNFESFIAPA
jgi:hypothetical protein